MNGRNFTQLGLLQAGVAPLTGGVATAGGSLRSGQAYAVAGQRPESNNYVVDGAKNINRMDGGYALRIPVDAIAEFRILTHTAPPEYGGTSGSSTSVVTKSGGNALHGSLYEFLRNQKMDARNFFSKEVEPLKQNQFGGTVGGPIRKDKLFFFGYSEGFRNRQGITRSGIVPTAAQRAGDFSGRNPPLLNLAAGGTPFPNGQLPSSQFDAVALNVLKLYPAGQHVALGVHVDPRHRERLEPGRRTARLSIFRSRPGEWPLFAFRGLEHQPDLDSRLGLTGLSGAGRPAHRRR